MKFKMIKHEVKNALGKSADMEINSGKKQVDTAGFITMQQQISGMFDPMIGSQPQHTQIETTQIAEHKDLENIDMIGVEINKFKPSKTEIIDRGRKANDRIRAEIHKAERDIGNEK